MILPGFPVAAGSGPEIIYLGYAYSLSGSAITIPSSAQAGDVAILFDTAIGSFSDQPVSVVPSGWTQIGSELVASSNAIKSIASRKVLASGDPGASVTGMSGPVTVDKVMLVFRASYGSWGTPTSVNAQSSTAPSNQTVAAASAPSVVIDFGAANTDVTLVMSSGEDGMVDFGYRQFGYKLHQSARPSTTVSLSGTSLSWAMLRSFAIPLSV